MTELGYSRTTPANNLDAINREIDQVSDVKMIAG
jgi:hypothetical protein